MCESTDPIDLIMVGSRALILLGILCAATLSIFMGAKMYRVGVSEKTSAEINGMGFKLILKSAGPGLCMIAFGIALLAVLATRTVTIEESQTATKHKTRASAVSAGGYLLVQATVPTTKTPAEDSVCVLRTKKRVFSTGVDPLTPAAIQANINAAIDAILQAGDSGIKSPVARASLVAQLKEIAAAAKDAQTP